MITQRDAVQFTRESADRIANVVRTLELTPARGAPLNYEALQQQQQRKVFRVCTFTGAWPVGSSKIVTFKYQTSTPNTASVKNLFWPIPNIGTRDCSIAKDGTAWFLLVPQLDSGTALSSATLGSSLEFGRINVPSFGTATTVSISTTTCAT